jgi:hypothetical protein
VFVPTGRWLNFFGTLGKLKTCYTLYGKSLRERRRQSGVLWEDNIKVHIKK